MHGDLSEAIGSPFKRQRSSIQGLDEASIIGPIGSNTNDVFPPSTLAAGHSNDTQQSAPEVKQEEAKMAEEVDEEL